jgi:hypothetical protein
VRSPYSCSVFVFWVRILCFYSYSVFPTWHSHFCLVFVLGFRIPDARSVYVIVFNILYSGFDIRMRYSVFGDRARSSFSVFGIRARVLRSLSHSHLHGSSVLCTPCSYSNIVFVFAMLYYCMLYGLSDIGYRLSVFVLWIMDLYLVFVHGACIRYAYLALVFARLSHSCSHFVVMRMWCVFTGVWNMRSLCECDSVAAFIETNSRVF